MKINRKLIAVFAMMSVALCGCAPEENFGVDANVPTPSELAYDEIGSSESSISVCWDATAAVQAGATSFTVQLLTSAGATADPYDATVSKTVLVPKDPESTAIYDAVLFEGLLQGRSYWIRMRANYPNSIYSNWVTLNDAAGEPARIKVGHGIAGKDDPLTAQVKGGIGFAWVYFDTMVDTTYEVYNGDKKLESMVAQKTDTETTLCVGPLPLNTDFNLTLKAIAPYGEQSVSNLTGKTGDIWHLTRNVSPTNVAVGWTDLSGNGNANRAYHVQLATDPEMKNLVYDLDCVDGQADVVTAYGATSWVGKKGGTNYNAPPAVSFGQLTPDTKYYFRVMTVAGITSQGVKMTFPLGNSMYSPVFEVKTEKSHVPAAKEILFEGFDAMAMQMDFMNMAGGTTPRIGSKANYTNPWPGITTAEWCVYPAATTHLFGTWGISSKAPFLDGNTTHKDSEVQNYVIGPKGGTLEGWHASDSFTAQQGYIKCGAGSETYNYLSTPKLTHELLKPEGTPCIISFKACPVITDVCKATIELGRDGNYEEVVEFNMDRACVEYTDESNYLWEGKWTTYSAEVVLKPGDNVAIRIRQKRFLLDDISIVAK